MQKVLKVLENKGDNYIFPFFWVRGEKEETLREYMQVIRECGIKAVCVESRPHPDFCGPGWWHDMDIILDEAKKRGMKVWILDDSHFPTGFANGAMKEKPDSLCRQSICCKKLVCRENETLVLSGDELKHPDPFVPNQADEYAGEKEPRKFDDDRLLSVCAVRADGGEKRDLTAFITGDRLEWTVPSGEWNVYLLHLSRNMGYHRSYINMMDAQSCRVLIDAVYEPHYAHYKDEFGKTIAGFFSDEPELGNGHIYDRNAKMGMEIDYPWSSELEEVLKEKLGNDYPECLYLLWENDEDENRKAQVRYAYMDAVSELVRKDFSMQIGEWCRSHGVQYIGHLIEDNDQHSRTGSSLGHYFRGLSGQDMAGIDDIVGQVLPQGEELNYDRGMMGCRDGEFYHYMLGKLGGSAAAIEPLKKGNSMCEIFGAYGWSEGVRLEKYLIDHFLVRGINHFVPHAFSAADYPDPDCPPHFYAHGHNPQYRHFGALMRYTNRMCELISGGKHIARAAVLYHAEGEWTGETMYSHKPGHLLCDAQIDYDYLPQDVFHDPETYRTRIENGSLQVNTQEYRTLIIPHMQYITKDLAEAVPQMIRNGVDVYFLEAYPDGICDAKAEAQTKLMEGVYEGEVIRTEDLLSKLEDSRIRELSITPADDRIRYYHYEYEDGTGVLLFVNEGTKIYDGIVTFCDSRKAFAYDAWENQLTAAEYDGNSFALTLEPMKSMVIVLAQSAGELESCVSEEPSVESKEEVLFSGSWKRSICRSIEYPDFKEERVVTIPDKLAEEEPYFSGFVRYENTFQAKEDTRYLLEIEDAYEGVEVFVNGESLGIQVVPVFRYDLSNAVKEGENSIRIEVATTLERENSRTPSPWGMPPQPTVPSGIAGAVRVFELQRL